MQMHKKPLHGHVQAYQLEVKIVLIYSLRERWEVAHKLGFDERSWDWLQLSEENKTSDLSEIGKYSKSIYSDAFNKEWRWYVQNPPPKKNKNKKDNKMKNICSGSSGKGGANEEIIKWSPVPLCQTNDK